MLNRVKVWIADKKIRLNNNVDNPIIGTEKKTTNELRQHKQAFSNFQACSLAPHDPSCDIITCTKNPCFVRKPDTIVSKEYSVKIKNPKSVEMGNYL